MDTIKIEGLKCFAYHGVYPEENEKGQDFILDIYLYLDLREAGKTDNLELTVNYGELCEFAKKYVCENKFNLLETVACGLSRLILLRYDKLLHGVKICMWKPNAPISADFKNVGVEIKRYWHDVFIGVGSNIGDREKYLKKGLHLLNLNDDIIIKQVSTFIETEPYGGVEMHSFLNAVARIKTLLEPHEVLTICNQIENECGRKRLIRWGPRTLDMDILFYDKLILDDERLTIPHIDIKNRDFVLKPMTEIAPGFVHPVYNKTMQDMLAELEDVDNVINL